MSVRPPPAAAPCRRAWPARVAAWALVRLPRPPRSAWLLAGALFANELWCNASVLLDCFGNAKVMRSVSAEMTALALKLGATLAGMLLLAGLLLLAVAGAWTACCRTVLADLVARRGDSRSLRVGFWFVASLAFVNAWYSAHALLLPASALRESWLVMLSGALARRPLEGGSALVAPACLAALAAALALRAFWLSPRLARRLGGAACGVALLVAAWGSWRAPGPAAPFTQQGNVVLLGLDSFQMNRLAVDAPVGGAAGADGAPAANGASAADGASGADGAAAAHGAALAASAPGPASVAPHIEAFLRSCFRFDNAWTPLARTYPSWISILTGREPVHHGVRFNLIGDDHLDPHNVFLPQLLADRGWATLHATDETRFSIIRPRFGFQSLVHPRMGAQDFLLAGCFDFSASNLLRRWRLGSDLFPAVAGNRASIGYAPDLWVEDAIAAIDALPRDRPVFIALHLCGDHWPFSTPAPWCHRSADPVACCMSMVDDQAGAILEHLRSVGLMDRSTVAMLSDHGDGWSGVPGDTNNSHGDDLRSPWANRIVLGLHAPGLAPGRSAELVRSFDLAPTLLDLLGVPHDPSTMDGRSLRPLLAGARPGAPPAPSAPPAGDAAATPHAEPPRLLFAETDLDRRVYTLKQLVQQNAQWYRTDPASGLLFLREEGFAEFMPLKWYMLVSGNRRLVVVPFRERFELHELDPATGRDRPDGEVAALPASERAALLDAVIEHFGLDGQALRAAAQARGFLPRDVAQAR